MKRRKRGYPCVRVVPTLVYRRIPVVCDLMPGLEVGEVGQRGKPSVSKKTKNNPYQKLSEFFPSISRI